MLGYFKQTMLAKFTSFECENTLPVWYGDLNSQPLNSEPPHPVTTVPGLLSYGLTIFASILTTSILELSSR